MTKAQTEKTHVRKGPAARAKSQSASSATTDDAEVMANDVRLLGRLSGAPVTVELPSGDALVTFRISVPRASPNGRRQVSGQRIDSVPCTAWAPRLRRSIATWRVGDVVEVIGAVRCRYYQAGGATRSRVEVEAASARIMRRSSAA